MQAQKEMNWWYFGYNGGLDFNATINATSQEGKLTSGLPNPVVGPLYTVEGCFTLSDHNGNLLMSSDGRTVYNKNNQVMKNGTGLLGEPTATQSGIVVPAPNNPNKFYVVTMASQEKPAAGLRYSVVNMDVNDPNDLGSVELNTKNSLLKDGICAENVTVVPHKNGIDYWLIHRTGDYFYVWELTDQGFSVNPIMYKTPTLPIVKGLMLGGYVGELIVSVDRSKLVNFCSQIATIISTDFDANTGIISDIRLKLVKPDATFLYGGTFSANGEYLYIGNTNLGNIKTSFKIKYSDLRAGDVNLSTLAPTAINYRLGPDKRVYGIFYTGTAEYEKRLIVITDPDEGGNDVRVFNAFLRGSSVYGLPNFAMSFLSIAPQAIPFSCAGYEAKLAVSIAISAGKEPTRLVWDFGDGSATKEQIFVHGTTDYKIYHLYPNSGKYTIKVTPYKGTTALSPTSFEMNITDCSIRSNRMFRQELLNKN